LPVKQDTWDRDIPPLATLPCNPNPKPKSRNFGFLKEWRL